MIGLMRRPGAWVVVIEIHKGCCYTQQIEKDRPMAWKRRLTAIP
jgi:hypothetical protein